MAWLLCMGAYTPSFAEPEDVQTGVLCTLTPRKSEYKTGETIQFTFTAQYADPGTEGAARDVKIGIPLPQTTPGLQFPMFSQTGSGEYAGVPMYSLNFSGSSTELYLVTLSDGSRRIEFTLNAGDTVQGTLSMDLPNGVSAPVDALTLTPEILSTSTYEHVVPTGGTTRVTADFGWNDVSKSGSTDNLGAIGASAKEHERIDYVISADSPSSGIVTGRIFTEHYVLGDTISLNGLHYDDGTLTSSEAGGISEFFIGGNKVLEIDKPLAGLTVDKVLSGSVITGFSIAYSASNTTLNKTDGTAQELANMNLNVGLILNEMKLNEGNEATSVVNSATFDAYSPFYAAQGDTPATHHHSAASHTAYTSDRYRIEKTVYTDEACTVPATLVSADQYVWYKVVVENHSAGNGPFSITDELPAGMIFESAAPAASSQSAKTLLWDNVTIPSGGTHTIIIKAKFDASEFTSNPVRNTSALSKDGQLIAASHADVRYLSGVVDDSSIVYTKNVNKTSAAENDSLRYTITAQNASSAAETKFVTIKDKWPGDNVRPTAITGCSDYELLDAEGNPHTLEEIDADHSIVITTVMLYNIEVPKGGKTNVYIDGVVTTPVAEFKNEIIGSAGQNLATAHTFGVRIVKDVFSYDSVSGIGAKLTNADAVAADQIVCYMMTVKSLTDMTISGLTLTDKLPAGLTPAVGSVGGVSAEAVIRYPDNTYAPVTLTPGAASAAFTPYTTAPSFELANKKSAVIYLFARVSAEAVAASNAGSNSITNAAYVNMPGGLATGDATANIYTHVDDAQSFCIKKSIAFVADYDDELDVATTRLFTDAAGTSPQWSNAALLWDGAYVCYRFELINRNVGNINKNPVSVYELTDVLPQGMEFVGVSTNGNSDAYTVTNASTAAVVAGKLNSLGTHLIRDGETGTWSNTAYASEQLTCNYDAVSNEVHITFNQDTNGMLPVRYHQSGAATNIKPYIYLIAKVTDGAKKALYHNTVEAKVAATVSLNTSISPKATERIEDGYRIIANTVDIRSGALKAGIAKELVGHYYPTATTPPTVLNPPEIAMGETLRFQIQLHAGASTPVNVGNSTYTCLGGLVLTDILPAEYVYRPGSAMLTLNATQNISNGAVSTSGCSEIPRGSFEPSVTQLGDGRTLLTWNLDSDALRLICRVNNNSTSALHLVTYDTDWNTAFQASYGNYTNEATVTHSEAFSSVYSGAPDYAKRTVSATAVVNVFGTAGTAALKSITNSGGKTTDGDHAGSGQNAVPVNGPDDVVRYTLSVKNSAEKSEMKSVVIIDELSRETGDTGVVNRKDRDSEFSIAFGAAPNVEVKLQKADSTVAVIDPSKYTVLYGMSAGGLNSGGDWSNAPSGGWVTWGGESRDMNAIRIAFDPDMVFLSDEVILVSFDAVVGDGADPGEVAWNSFGYTYRSVNLSDNTESSKIYAEPLKVGAYVPSALLNVTKTVTGDPAPAEAEFTFILKKADGTVQANVKYIINGGTDAFRTGSDGSFKLKAGDTATLYVKDGSYTVEEVQLPLYFTFDSASPSATGDGSSSGMVFTSKPLALNGSAGVEYKNVFSMPSVIDLTVEKKWAGDIDPSRPASVLVQLCKDGAPYGTAVTLEESNGWKHTWVGLDNSFAWTVREVTALPIGYTSSTSGSQLSSYTITNTYSSPRISVQVEKRWTGDPDPSQPSSVQMQLYKDGAPYGTAVSLNGQNGWKHVWTDLSSTSTWTVRETSPLPFGYASIITGSAASGFVVTNRFTAPAKLTVSKTVTGGGSASALFTFRFTFSAAGNFPYTGSTSGTVSTGGSIRLKHGESITITLPKGVDYTVVEDAVNQYVPTPANRTFTGTTGDAEAFAAFSNLYDAPYSPPPNSLTGNLSIQKTVTGDLGDTEKEFTFTVVFNAAGSYDFTGSKSGTIASGDTVRLRHGEYITVINLPAGTAYSVTESDNGGYRVYASGATGFILNNRDVVAAFTNSMGGIPLTGDDNSVRTGVCIMAAALVGLIVTCVLYRRVTKRRKKA